MTLRNMREELKSISDSLFSFFLEQLRFLQGLFCKCLPHLKLFYSVWHLKTGHSPCVKNLSNVLYLLSWFVFVSLFSHVFLVQLLCRDHVVVDGWLSMTHGNYCSVFSAFIKSNQIPKGRKKTPWCWVSLY